jgi:hypothetical protein
VLALRFYHRRIVTLAAAGFLREIRFEWKELLDTQEM